MMYHPKIEIEAMEILYGRRPEDKGIDRDEIADERNQGADDISEQTISSTD